MFPSYENDYEAFEEQCMRRYGAKPRPHWITTEFGGKVKLLLCLLSLDHNWISFNNELIGYVFVENIVSVEEIWKQHHILQWNARFVEPWRVSSILHDVKLVLDLDLNILIFFLSYIFRVLKNISSSIIALVTKKGNILLSGGGVEKN